MNRKPLGHYRPRFKTTFFCKWCGRPFDASRKDAELCSPKCRQARRRAGIQAQELLLSSGNGRGEDGTPLPLSTTTASHIRIVHDVSTLTGPHKRKR